MRKSLLAIALRLHCLPILLTASYTYAHSNPEVFAEFPNTYFVETGSHKGDGIQQALDLDCFETIHSIEILPQYYNYVIKRFQNTPNVILWLGDSGVMLQEVLQRLDAPATFWLDGHVSCLPGVGMSPILRELECIKSHAINTHTILIDDVRDFGSVYFDFVTKEKIVSTILEINPNYKIEYRDCPAATGDILVAYISKD